MHPYIWTARQVRIALVGCAGMAWAGYLVYLLLSYLARMN